MPTYEYRCPACAREFERFQRMSDPPGAPCPDCGQAADRLISAGGGLLFKGDGFYITDYRSDAYKDKAKKDRGEGPKEDGGGRSDGGGPRDGGGKSDGQSSVRNGKQKDPGARGTRAGDGDAGRKHSRGAGSTRSGSRRASRPAPRDVGERHGG